MSGSVGGNAARCESCGHEEWQHWPYEPRTCGAMIDMRGPTTGGPELSQCRCQGFAAARVSGAEPPPAPPELCGKARTKDDWPCVREAGHYGPCLHEQAEPPSAPSEPGDRPSESPGVAADDLSPSRGSLRPGSLSAAVSAVPAQAAAAEAQRLIAEYNDHEAAQLARDDRSALVWSARVIAPLFVALLARVAEAERERDKACWKCGAIPLPPGAVPLDVSALVPKPGDPWLSSADRIEFFRGRAERAEAEADRLRAALTALLARHVTFVASGDCGFWDVETEDEVIAARAALAGGDAA